MPDRIKKLDQVFQSNGYVLSGETDDFNHPIYRHPNGTEVVVFKKGFGFNIVRSGTRIKHARSVAALDRFIATINAELTVS